MRPVSKELIYLIDVRDIDIISRTKIFVGKNKNLRLAVLYGLAILDINQDIVKAVMVLHGHGDNIGNV